jgi:FeS assembly SUF system protein
MAEALIAAQALREQIVEALKTVYDPEIPVDIYELGLIYTIEVDEEGHVDIDMTLTAPACPVAGSMPGMIKSAVETVEGVKSCQVELVWEPQWTHERMSEVAKLQLGFM